MVFLSIFRKIVACVCWAYAETILSHAEHTRNRFYHTLSILGTNFRACSACGKMWTVITCTVHAQHTRNEFYCTLSIRGMNFIACWAYLEPISSHAEHARKCLKVEYLPNRIRFSKISCYRPLGPYGFRSCKKSIKKCQACVPLRVVGTVLVFFLRRLRWICTVLQPMGSKGRYLN